MHDATTFVRASTPRKPATSPAQFSDWGAVQGHLELSPAILEQARHLAVRHLAACEAEDFSGDAVESFPLPGWLSERKRLMPLAELRALGFAPVQADLRTGAREFVLATVGVDSHVDGAPSPVFALVLHNDNLKFKQGRQSHKTLAGQWYVFNEGLPHEVREGKNSTAYVVWTAPLKALA